MNWNSTDRKEVRKFGFIALVFFGSLSGLGLVLKKPLPTYLFGFLTILGFGFFLLPSHLAPLYTIWLKTAHLLGKIVNTLILTLAYYLVITPSALIKWLLGGSKERFLKRY
jgi:hypothetical protein